MKPLHPLFYVTYALYKLLPTNSPGLITFVIFPLTVTPHSPLGERVRVRWVGGGGGGERGGEKERGGEEDVFD